MNKCTLCGASDSPDPFKYFVFKSFLKNILNDIS